MNYWRCNPGCDHFLTIDLRTPQEIDKCPAESDIILNIPLPPLSPEQIEDTVVKVYKVLGILEPEQCMKIFCAKGKRSALVVAILKQAGFKNIVDLGGIECK